MGWFEDSIEEFRKLPPAGKVAVGGAAVGVALLAYASYRANAGNASAANSNNTGTTGTGADSALTGLGVPSLSSSPADWQNWFSNGLTIPQTASDGAPAGATGGSTGGSGGSTSSGGVTYTPPAASAASAASSVQTAAAHVASSVSAPTPPPAPKPAPAQSYPIQNPTAPAQIAHRPLVGPVHTFIPTTIRPIAPPTGTRSGGRAI